MIKKTKNKKQDTHQKQSKKTKGKPKKKIPTNTKLT